MLRLVLCMVAKWLLVFLLPCHGIIELNGKVCRCVVLCYVSLCLPFVPFYRCSVNESLSFVPCMLISCILLCSHLHLYFACRDFMQYGRCCPIHCCAEILTFPLGRLRDDSRLCIDTSLAHTTKSVDKPHNVCVCFS